MKKTTLLLIPWLFFLAVISYPQIYINGTAGGTSLSFPLLAPNGSFTAPAYSFSVTNAGSAGLFFNTNETDVKGADAVAGTDVAATLGRAQLLAGRGRGTGAGGNLALAVAVPGATGSSLNSYSTVFFSSGTDGETTLGGPTSINDLQNTTLRGPLRATGVTNGDTGNTVIRSGRPTGNATVSTISFETSSVGASGTSQQAVATRLTLAETTATFTTPFTSTNSTTLGWAVVAGADTACNTTCTNACVFGWNLTAGNIDGTLLACTDATADACLCAGSS